MASYRIGIGSFNLKDGAVGIGTESTGLGNLKVEGTIKTTDLDVGVSTFTRYAGFEGEEAKFDKDISLSGEYSTTGDIVVEPGGILTVGLGSTACIGSVECISVKHHFSVPVGDTAGRNKSSGYAEGTVRYNRDLGTMEFFNGNEWRQFTYISDIQNSPSSCGRVIYAGGNPGSSPNTKSDIEFLNATTQGNSSSFGDLTESVRNKGGGSSSTRGIFSSGASPNSTSNTNVIEYVTIQSAGNSIEFGDSTAARRNPGGASNSTRFLTAGGYVSSASNIIDYVEINTLGNALDFGDLRISKYYPAGIASPIRAVFSGGTTPGNTETMSFVKFASKGNAVNFGELSSGGGTFQSGGASNGVRGVLSGIYNPSATYISTIEYLTIASEGNTTHFGSLTVGRSASGSTGGTRGIFAAGSTGSNTNIIDFINIASAGDASDFGDMNDAMSGMAGVSDSHGGLGGY